MVEKYSNIKFHDNLTSRIQVVSIIKRYMADQTMTHHNCAKSPKIVIRFSSVSLRFCMKLLTFTFN